MPFFSKLFKKKGEKLTKVQLDEIEAKVQEAKKYFEGQEKKKIKIILKRKKLFLSCQNVLKRKLSREKSSQSMEKY